MKHRIRVWWNMWLNIRFMVYYLVLLSISTFYASAYPFLPQKQGSDVMSPFLSGTAVVILSFFAVLFCIVAYDWEMAVEKKVVKGAYIEATGGELSLSEVNKRVSHEEEIEVEA